MNGAHLHLILNHLPIVGSLVASVLLGVTAWRAPRGEADRYGYWALVATALAAILTYVSGGGAEHTVEHLAGISADAIGHHQLMAAVAMIVSVLLALFAAIPLVLGLTGRRELAIAFLVLSLVANALYAVAGEAGGAIHHPEML